MTLPQAKQIFAHLMEVSRKRALRPLEKRTLIRARQTLRSHKKPTSNPKERFSLYRKRSRRVTRKRNVALPLLVNPKKRVKIYENVLRVEAQKGPGHRCDPGCKKVNHCYYHNFKRPFPSMYGLPDKSLLIRSK